MEESLNRAVAERDAMRTRCDAEKEQLQKNFDQRIAGLRLEKEQARLRSQMHTFIATAFTA